MKVKRTGMVVIMCQFQVLSNRLPTGKEESQVKREWGKIGIAAEFRNLCQVKSFPITVY
jgi:hypothetical protein